MEKKKNKIAVEDLDDVNGGWLIPLTKGDKKPGMPNVPGNPEENPIAEEDAIK